MKIIPGLVATLVLSSMLSLPAFAAGQPISVQINQQKLDLSKYTPLNDHGTVMVPFRPIFEKLGLQVSWDAATGSITGTKAGLVIKLRIGSKQASINGVVKQLTLAPKVIDNATYIPLRFVGEATGNEISWDAKQQAVAINVLQASVDPKEINSFFEKYITYSNNENYDGFMALIDPQSPLAGIGPQIKSQMEAFDLTSSIKQLEIIDLQPKEATVHTVETTKRISGPFMLDNTADYVYGLTKDVSGTGWKISNLQINAIQYTLPEGILSADISIPKTEENQILSMLAANTKYTNEENLDGVLATIDGEALVQEQNKQAYSQIFNTYDLLFTTESTKIINYTEDTAAVYVVQTTKKLKGPEFQDNRSIIVSTLKKSADGLWKLEQSFVIKTDKL
ncbi:copper amine oxidase N-terminal domain-containing protein [Paenibacillus sp. 19GGS1-52]|uniref:copper amine oxidase N-terminal domain-containing protein n=1 Tax=Paenibacillus sp. 19GGS1-52 TaxID=2758563 RepID=UPI001EFBBF16|nr:copper amine oxidase N-terminal domain-containing protein [Paenibacillus sp. 19GGS1-52]ULO08010.1 copper amine oxidase N-terminal domain-containing protein [Paenibacillus sp. 19GGS1-52]